MDLQMIASGDLVPLMVDTDYAELTNSRPDRS